MGGLREVGLPLQGTHEQRKVGFVRSAGLGHWWGGFDGERLLELAGITALYESVAQIGGVFTHPERRRGGPSRAAMTTLIHDAQRVHHLDRLFLFTGEQNIARQMYESLGFERFGHFGLFFGEPSTQGRKDAEHSSY